MLWIRILPASFAPLATSTLPSRSNVAVKVSRPVLRLPVYSHWPGVAAHGCASSAADKKNNGNAKRRRSIVFKKRRAGCKAPGASEHVIGAIPLLTGEMRFFIGINYSRRSPSVKGLLREWLAKFCRTGLACSRATKTRAQSRRGVGRVQRRNPRLRGITLTRLISRSSPRDVLQNSNKYPERVSARVSRASA